MNIRILESGRGRLPADASGDLPVRTARPAGLLVVATAVLCAYARGPVDRRLLCGRRADFSPVGCPSG